MKTKPYRNKKAPKPLRYQAGMFARTDVDKAATEDCISKLTKVLRNKLGLRLVEGDEQRLSEAIWNFLSDEEAILEFPTVQDQADFIRLATGLIVFLFDCGYAEGIYDACGIVFRQKDGEMNENDPKCKKLLNIWRRFDYQ